MHALSNRKMLQMVILSHLFVLQISCDVFFLSPGGDTDKTIPMIQSFTLTVLDKHIMVSKYFFC